MDRQMMQHIRDVTADQLEAILNRFPEGGLGYIGCTSKPIERFTTHAGVMCFIDGPYRRQKSIIFEKDEANPTIDNNELILFRCCWKSQALLFEYLLQWHCVDRKGELHKRFGSRMNVMRPARTQAIVHEEKVAHYVYVISSQKIKSKMHFYLFCDCDGRYELSGECDRSNSFKL
jgi:hypothetical protein